MVSGGTQPPKISAIREKSFLGNSEALQFSKNRSLRICIYNHRENLSLINQTNIWILPKIEATLLSKYPFLRHVWIDQIRNLTPNSWIKIRTQEF